MYIHMEGEELEDVEITHEGDMITIKQDGAVITMIPEAARSLAFALIGMTDPYRTRNHRR